MSKIVTFTDQTFAELVRYFALGMSTSLSGGAQNEIRSIFVADAPVIVTPPGKIPTSVLGFDKVLGYEWDWLHGPNNGAFGNDTQKSGGIGTNGIVIVGFTASVAGEGGFSVVPYPGNVDDCPHLISISETPGDFSMPFGTAKRAGGNISFWVGPGGIADIYALLTLGRRYYANICNRDTHGVSYAAELRVSGDRPR